MADEIQDSSGSFISLSSVIVGFRKTMREELYEKITRDMESGVQIPGVKYRRSPKKSGWQICAEDESRLEDYGISLGYIIPSRLNGQRILRIEKSIDQNSQDGVPKVPKQVVERDHFFDFDPSLITQPVPELFSLKTNPDECADGLAELLGDISDNTCDAFRVKEDLVGRYCLTPQEISLIGIKGTSDDKFTYDRKDVLRGLLKSPRIEMAAEKLASNSLCEMLHYAVVCSDGRN